MANYLPARALSHTRLMTTPAWVISLTGGSLPAGQSLRCSAGHAEHCGISPAQADLGCSSVWDFPLKCRNTQYSTIGATEDAVSSISKAPFHLANSDSQLKTQMKTTLVCEMLLVRVPTPASRSLSYNPSGNAPPPPPSISWVLQPRNYAWFVLWSVPGNYSVFTIFLTKQLAVKM